MTIHSGDPFADPSPDRNPLRRLRGRLTSPVTVWALGAGSGRRGLTVSSVLVADGDPGEVLGLVDGDSELADRLSADARFAVSLLDQRHRGVADVFAGSAPSPGGMFRTGDWLDTEWGPVLAEVSWFGARVISDDEEHAGWARLVRARIEHVELAEAEGEPLVHLRGRYRRVDTY